MNSDIYSSVLTGKKLIVLVLDNGGFAVINKLQNNTGQDSFNNLIADCPTVARTLRRRFRGPCPRHGGECRNRGQPGRTGRGVPARQGRRRKTSVIVMQVDPYEGWTTQGHAWWEIGTAEVSDSADVRGKACRGGSRARRPEAGRLMADLARLAGRTFWSSAAPGWTFTPIRPARGSKRPRGSPPPLAGHPPTSPWPWPGRAAGRRW